LLVAVVETLPLGPSAACGAEEVVKPFNILTSASPRATMEADGFDIVEHDGWVAFQGPGHGERHCQVGIEMTAGVVQPSEKDAGLTKNLVARVPLPSRSA
jgi:hypothetical protein